MSPEVLGIVAVGVLIAAAVYAFKPKRPPAPPAVQAAAPAPVYIQAPAVMPDLLDLHIDYQDKRERQIRREAQQRRLDQAALERAALEKIGELLVAPVPTAPPAAPPNG